MQGLQVAHGVMHAAKLYPNSYLVQVLVGTAKGAGSGVLKTFEQVSPLSLSFTTWIL
jgi:hypothetical protein